MSSQAITIERVQEIISIIEDCLKKGFSPPLAGGKTNKAITEAVRICVEKGVIGTRSGFTHRYNARKKFGLEPNWNLWKGPNPDATVGKLKSVDKERIEQLKNQVKILEREAREKDKEYSRLESVVNKLESLGERSLAPVTFSPRVHNPSAPGIPMMIWSDWHWGERVEKDEMGGVNEFNLNIAHQRLDKLVDRSLDLMLNHMVKPEYEGLVLCLGGDMISGDIHEELAVSNDGYMTDILEDLDDHLAGALEKVGEKFDKILIPCVVGNHGRMTRKPRFKGRTGTNHEYNIYLRLKKHFERKGDRRFKFLIPRRADVHFRVYKWRFLLTHGDALGVKGGDGIIGNLGPLMRGRVKVGGAEAKIGQDFDVMVVGHWHDYICLPEKGLIVNGSLKGLDEYAHLSLRAANQRPLQALWFCHPVHGITARWPIFLEEDIMAIAQSDLPWTSWKE